MSHEQANTIITVLIVMLIMNIFIAALILAFLEDIKDKIK